MVKMKQQAGQVALILVLVMTVASAVAASLAGRTILELRTQTTETDSLQAQKAAEAALEQVILNRGSIGTTNLEGSLQYSGEFEEIGQSGYITEQSIPVGGAITVKVAGTSDEPTQVTLYWSGDAAFRVSEYTVDGGGSSHVYYQTVDTIAGRGNSFDSSGIGGGTSFMNKDFGHSKTVSLMGPGLGETVSLIRIMILYESSAIGIGPNDGLFAAQGIKATGLGTDTETNTNSKLEGVILTESVPVIFDNVLYTRGSISQ